MVVSMTGFGIVIPIVPFFGLHLGASATDVTWALGAYSLGQLIASPLWGWLSDRYGRRPVLIASVSLTALSYVVLAFASSMLEVGIIRFATGLMAGNIAAGFAAAADLSDERTRTRTMGMVAAGFGLGFIIGPAVGGLVAGPDAGPADFARVCFVAAALAGAAALGAVAAFPETRRSEARGAPRPATPSLVARPTLTLLVLVTLMGIAALALLETVFGVWAAGALDWDAPETGLAFAALGLVAAGLQGGAAGPLARRFGDHRLMMAGLACYLLGFLILIVTSAVWQAILAMAVLAVGAGLFTPTLQALVARQAASHERGAVLGLQQSASSLGRVLGPVLAGPAFDLIGAQAPFIAGALLALAALACAATAAPQLAPERAT